MFSPVTRTQNKLRLAIDGPAGSGKTFTALAFAHALAGPGGRIAVIDTENSTASKYAGEQPDGGIWTWDNLNLLPGQYAPTTYAQAIREAGAAKYDVLIIDSLSHAWEGSGGALDQVDRASERGDGNKFAAWRNVTPQHRALVEAMMTSPCHVIATMRSKMEYVLEPNERGKMVPRKVGLKPIQRDGLEYEFDLVCDIDLGHIMTVSKSRCSAVDGQIVSKPTGEWIAPVRAWLYSGIEAPAPAPAVTPGPIPTAAPPVLTPEQARLREALLYLAQGSGAEARKLLATYAKTPGGKNGAAPPASVAAMDAAWVYATWRRVEPDYNVALRKAEDAAREREAAESAATSSPHAEPDEDAVHAGLPF
jgi:hypothetical protein